MRVSLEWLSEMVTVPWPAEELAERLTMAGVKVEAVRRPFDGLSGVVVGRVEAMDRHPASDALWLARVLVTEETGTGARRLTIVSGAGNPRPGDLVCVAPPGAVLPGGWRIDRQEIRGQVSEGMLLAASELLLGAKPRPDEEILVVAPDASYPGGPPRIGQDVVSLLELDDVVFELDLTPNYAVHCQSVFGVAMEVAALAAEVDPACGRVRKPVGEWAGEGPPVSEVARVVVEEPELCPRYVGCGVVELKPGPAPLWLQRRLAASGLRPINNVVDVTNYVMLEWGQPLHAFDAARLEDRTIVVRRARPKESLVTLDGVERNLDEEVLVIADARRAVGIAGVMGGENTEVSSATREVLLEAAHFDPRSVRRTSQRFGIRSEAAIRFEKWVDPNTTPVAADRAVALLREVAGGVPARGRIDCYPRPYEPRRIRVRPRRVNLLLGTDLDATDQANLLERLHFEVDAVAAYPAPGREAATAAQPADREIDLWVTVPTRRQDVAGEADVAEEIARLYGYGRIASTMPRGQLTRGHRRPVRQAADQVRHHLAGLGLTEVVTYAFLHPGVFDRLRLPPDHPHRRAVRLRNPMTEDQSLLRPWLVPSVLEAAAANVRRRADSVRLFELGTVHLPAGKEAEELPREETRLALLLWGYDGPPAWNRSRREVDFYDLKGLVEEVLAFVGVDGAFAPATPRITPAGRRWSRPRGGPLDTWARCTRRSWRPTAGTAGRTWLSCTSRPSWNWPGPCASTCRRPASPAPSGTWRCWCPGHCRRTGWRRPSAKGPAPSWTAWSCSTFTRGTRSPKAGAAWPTPWSTGRRTGP